MSENQPDRNSSTAEQLLAKLPTFDLYWPDEIRAAWFNSLRCIMEHMRGRVSGEREWQSWMGEMEFQSW